MIKHVDANVSDHQYLAQEIRNGIQQNVNVNALLLLPQNVMLHRNIVILNVDASANQEDHHLDAKVLLPGVKPSASANVLDNLIAKDHLLLTTWDANVFATRETVQEIKSWIRLHVLVNAHRDNNHAQLINVGTLQDVNANVLDQNQNKVAVAIKYGMTRNVNAYVQINQEKAAQELRNGIHTCVNVDANNHYLNKDARADKDSMTSLAHADAPKNQHNVLASKDGTIEDVVVNVQESETAPSQNGSIIILVNVNAMKNQLKDVLEIKDGRTPVVLVNVQGTLIVDVMDCKHSVKQVAHADANLACQLVDALEIKNGMIINVAVNALVAEDAAAVNRLGMI